MIKLINDDANNIKMAADIIMTDPPFDMSGHDIYKVLSNYDAKHLLLICTLKQLLEFDKYTDFKFSFHLVFDFHSPKKSMSMRQPFYIHYNVVYYKKGKSAFNRSRGHRRDVFTKDYFPSIFSAPRNGRESYAKDIGAMTDLLSYFDVKSVVDPFAGSGTTGLACLDNDINCTLIEIDKDRAAKIKDTFKFLGIFL